jgi:hypothetical protein
MLTALLVLHVLQAAQAAQAAPAARDEFPGCPSATPIRIAAWVQRLREAPVR